MAYQREQGSTSSPKITDEILALVDAVAADIHDSWIRHLTSQDWKQGDHFDETRREHPCLVRYSQLPSFEREAEHNAVRDTVLRIAKQGYVIRRAPPPEHSLRGRLMLFANVFFSMLVNSALLIGWVWLQLLATYLIRLVPPSGIVDISVPVFQTLFAFFTLLPVLVWALSDIARIMRERRQSLRRP